MDPRRPKPLTVPPLAKPGAVAPKASGSLTTSPGQPKVENRTGSLPRVKTPADQDEFMDGATSTINRSEINRIIDAPSNSFDDDDDEFGTSDATSTIDRNALNKIIDAYHSSEPVNDERTSALNSQELNKIISAHSSPSNPSLRPPSSQNNFSLRPPSSQNVPRIPSGANNPSLRPPSSQSIPRIPSGTNNPAFNMDDLDPEAFDGATSTIDRSEINRILDGKVPTPTAAPARRMTPWPDDPVTDTDNFDGATSTIDRNEIDRIINAHPATANAPSSLNAARTSTDPEVPRYADDSHSFSDVTAIPLAEVDTPEPPKQPLPSSPLSPQSPTRPSTSPPAPQTHPPSNTPTPPPLARTLHLLSSLTLTAAAILLATQGAQVIAGLILIGATALGAVLGLLSGISRNPSRELLLATAALNGVAIAVAVLAWVAEISSTLIPVSLAGALLGLVGSALRLRR